MSTKPDYDSIAYFFRYKHLEYMSDWQDQKELMRKHHPEVIKAYEDLQVAQKTFKVLLNSVLEER